jgi:hypothetical protein
MLLPLMAATSPSEKHAVQTVLDKMIVGEVLPPEILDRQENHPEFPNLDEAIASVRGCKVKVLDPAGKGIYGVQWWCKGRKRKEQPSAMLVFVDKGQVTKITTAFVSTAY